VLITGMVTKVVEENKAWLETIFEFVNYWEENLYLGNKIRWVRIWSVLLSM